MHDELTVVDFEEEFEYELNFFEIHSFSIGFELVDVDKIGKNDKIGSCNLSEKFYPKVWIDLTVKQEESVDVYLDLIKI